MKLFPMQLNQESTKFYGHNKYIISFFNAVKWRLRYRFTGDNLFFNRIRTLKFQSSQSRFNTTSN